MKTITGVPESLTLAQYLSLIESVGFDAKNLQRLEFRTDGIYAWVPDLDENGRRHVDSQTDELAVNRVFIPVRDA